MTDRQPRTSLRPTDGFAELRELCRRELAREPARPAPRALVPRAVIEVRLDGRTELVTLAAENGRLLVLATDESGSGPSPAARAAMQWLAGEASGSPAALIVEGGREPESRLSERLGELVSAVVRSGMGDDPPPAVRDALALVVAELPSPLTPAAGRWLARLAAAIAEMDARQVARLLTAATSPDLRHAPPFGGTPRPLSDRRYVELGREQVDAWGAAPIERRVLVDVETGELCTESRLGTTLPASVGPCPRILEVGLGAASGAHPADLSAHQYTVSSEIPSEVWDRVEGHAVSIATASAAAQAALAAAPATAEPLSLVLGPVVEDGQLVDEHGARLPLSREDPGASEVLVELARRQPLRWVLVRWATRDTGLSAVPIAAGHRQGSSWAHVRLR